MSAPTVSVIIPAYNAEAYVGEAIRSVLAQSFRDVELLVVDDGSTDGTAAVVQGFGPGVRYLYQPNAGLPAARNAGIRLARGAIIAFLDADDLWLPDFLDAVVGALLADRGVDGAYAWARYITPHGRVLPGGMGPTPAGDTLERVFLMGGSQQFSMVALRREVFERVGLFDEELRQAQDWDFLLRAAAADIRFACVPRILVHRRVHGESLAADPERHLAWERRVLAKALATLPLPDRLRALAPVAEYRMVVRAAMTHWRQGHHQAAVDRLAEAMASWPEAAERPQTYLGLLHRLLPVGVRCAQTVGRELPRLMQEGLGLLDLVLAHPLITATAAIRPRRARAAFHTGVAYLALRSLRLGLAVRAGLQVVAADPTLPLRPIWRRWRSTPVGESR